MYATLAFLVACAAPTTSIHPSPPAGPAPTEQVSASDRAARDAVTAPDRSAPDRALDSGRKPAETLVFFGIAPGMRVLEIGAGSGYTAELLARIVGPRGEVYGQNAPFVLERFAKAPWSERLKKPVMSRVRRIDAPFDAPLPPELRGLDAAVNVLFYHDTVWQEVDRTAMNRHVFDALKPGGIYGIVDHSARPEDGLEVTHTLHRIAEDAVIAEITAAGFVLDARSDLLENPEDSRDWNAAPGASGDRRGTSDRFVLRFRKP